MVMTIKQPVGKVRPGFATSVQVIGPLTRDADLLALSPVDWSKCSMPRSTICFELADRWLPFRNEDGLTRVLVRTMMLN